MDRHHVGAAEHVVQVLAALAVEERLHPEPLRAPGHGLADAARPDHQQRGTGELEPEPAARSPAVRVAAANRRGGVGQPPRDGQDQRHRQVRRRIGEHVRRDAHRNPPRRDRREVDVVVRLGHLLAIRVHDEPGDRGVRPRSAIVFERTAQHRREQPRADDVLTLRPQVERGHEIPQLLTGRRPLARPDLDVVVVREPLDGGAGQPAGDDHSGHAPRFCRPRLGYAFS